MWPRISQKFEQDNVWRSTTSFFDLGHAEGQLERLPAVDIRGFTAGQHQL
jgi:hypothetical protein